MANEWDPVQLEEWGLDVWQPDAEPAEGLTDPDDVPEVPEEPITKPGALWLLGDHRLLCGDSTKAEDVERLMDGNKADMCMPGDNIKMVVELLAEMPIAMEENLRFAIREGGRTVGSGVVIKILE